MSYCRWSNDNWRCDVYCYEDCRGGYTTHVAGNRVVGEIPEVPDILKADIDVWLAAHQKQIDFLDKAKRKSIELPYVGESFNDPDLQSFLERLINLREIGYNVPAWVIKDVQEELESIT